MAKPVMMTILFMIVIGTMLFLSGCSGPAGLAIAGYDNNFTKADGDYYSKIYNAQSDLSGASGSHMYGKAVIVKFDEGDINSNGFAGTPKFIYKNHDLDFDIHGNSDNNDLSDVSKNGYFYWESIPLADNASDVDCIVYLKYGTDHVGTYKSGVLTAEEYIQKCDILVVDNKTRSIIGEKTVFGKSPAPVIDDPNREATGPDPNLEVNSYLVSLY